MPEPHAAPIQVELSPSDCKLIRRALIERANALLEYEIRHPPTDPSGSQLSKVDEAKALYNRFVALDHQENGQ